VRPQVGGEQCDRDGHRPGTFPVSGGINAVSVDEYRRRGPEELLTLLRDHLEPQGLTAGFGGVIGLVDGLIHHQDIRRPLGLPREIPPERLLPTLQAALTAPLIRGFWRVRGLRLVATDLEWSTGKGPEVRGPAESLLMAMAGRRGVVGELSGPASTRITAGPAPTRVKAMDVQNFPKSSGRDR
jgi:uncharacterized protein (TIGR03083 family)